LHETPLEGFDFQVLLDPFEEQLDLQAFFFDRCNRLGRQTEVIGQEDIVFSRFSITASSGNMTYEVWKEYIKNQQPQEPDDDFIVV